MARKSRYLAWVAAALAVTVAIGAGRVALVARRRRELRRLVAGSPLGSELGSPVTTTGAPGPITRREGHRLPVSSGEGLE